MIMRQAGVPCNSIMNSRTESPLLHFVSRKREKNGKSLTNGP
jgi:hypothetical protein